MAWRPLSRMEKTTGWSTIAVGLAIGLAWILIERISYAEEERSRLSYLIATDQRLWDTVSCMENGRINGLKLQDRSRPIFWKLENEARHVRIEVHEVRGGLITLVFTRDGSALRDGELDHLQECLGLAEAPARISRTEDQPSRSNAG